MNRNARVLAQEIGERARQKHVLQHVGEIAGVEFVAIVHDAAALGPRGQRSGDTLIWDEWQVWPAILGQST